MEEGLDKVTRNTEIIFHHLDLFQKLNKIISNNQRLKKMDATLWGWMQNAFTVDLVISMARICDSDNRTDSFIQFLKDLKHKPEYLTRERYVKLYNSSDKFMLDLANKEFDELAGIGQQFFSSKLIDADIMRLSKEEPCKKIIDFRDQYIAHSDKKKNAPAPTYGELFKSFDIIEEVVKKYNSLIRSTSILKLTPETRGNWEEALTIPWLDMR